MILRKLLLAGVMLATAVFSSLDAHALTCRNQPAGATNLATIHFNTTDGEGQLWDLYPGAGQIRQPSGVEGNASASVLSPGNGTGGQQVIWPKPGFQQPLTNLYSCFRWKVNSQFVGIQTNNKLIFQAAQDWTFGKQGINGVLSVPKRGAYPPYEGGNAGLQMIFGPNSRTDIYDNSHACALDFGLMCYPNVNDTQIQRDTWYEVELYIIASSCTTCKNATVKWWIDGVPQGSYTNLNYGDGIVNEFQINHTWDNGSDKQCGPPTNPSNVNGRDCRNEQVHYFDELILSAVGNVIPGQGGNGGTTPPATPPGTVSDVTLTPISSTSLNVQFTTAANTDSYEIRFAPGTISWGAAQPVTAGTCTSPYANSTSGQVTSCNITGLSPDTQYQVQLVGKLGTTYGLLSNIATGLTSAVSSGGGGTPTPTVTTYSFVSQFSGVQGQNGWSYLDVPGTSFSFNAGSQLWEGPQAYQGVWQGGFHPGTSVGTKVRWTAPSAGVAAVTGSFKVYDAACSGGVTFEAWVNGTLKFTQTTSAGSGTEYPYSYTHSAASGDTFDFIVLPNGSNTCDSTQLNPSIAFTTGGVGGVAAPTLTGFTPLSGLVGSTVTITGTNFGSTPSSNTVKFNGTTAVVTAASTTTLTVTVPASASSGTLSVQTAGGTATSSGTFTVSVATVQPTPTITALISTDTYRVINGTDVWDLRGPTAPFVLYRNGSCGACNLVGYSLIFSAALNTVGLEFIPGKYMYWDTALSEWVIISGTLPYTPPVQVSGTFTFTGNAAAGFNVYRSEAAGGVKTKLPVISTYRDRSFTDTQHSFGCFEVAAYGANGEEGPHSAERCTIHGQGLSREIGLLNPLLVVDFKGRVWELRGGAAPYTTYIDGICRCSMVGYSLRYVEGEAHVEFLPGKWMRFDDTLDDWVIVAP